LNINQLYIIVKNILKNIIKYYLNIGNPIYICTTIIKTTTNII